MNGTGLRFALCARTSTEDLQDPADSLRWQRARAEAVIAGHGEIVTVFHDVGYSRSIPWRRRPQASAILDEAARPDRRWDALVVGEPQRAFYGADFAMIFPVLVHHGVELWVPEVGGRVDPGSEAHDMVMSLFGGMSKAERNRIRTRVKAMMVEHAKAGRWLGGRPPYGYRLRDIGAHPHPEKGRHGARLYTLEPDPATGPVVARIFAAYLKGGSYKSIAQELTAEGIPSPSGADPGRNRHRAAAMGAWGASSVRTILMNEMYTGRYTWGRTQWDETQLFDPSNPSLGQRRRQVGKDRAEWVQTAEPVFDGLVDEATFAAAQRRRTDRHGRPDGYRKNRTTRTYALRGLLFCEGCGRRMQSLAVGPRHYYRCRLNGPDYARNPALEATHPAITRNLAEAPLVRELDAWIGQLFDPDNLEATVTALAAAAPTQADTGAEVAARRLAAAEDKLRKYREALEAGAGAEVAKWIREATQERDMAKLELGGARKPEGPPSVAEIREQLARLGDMTARLAEATPEQRQEIYQALGVRLTFQPGGTTVTAEVVPMVRVGGGT